MKINIDLENPCRISCEDCIHAGTCCWKVKMASQLYYLEHTYTQASMASNAFFMGWEGKQRKELE